ncbi:DivIVA domain-containing protein [Blastococcus sp. TF02-8]|uniref:DivIVA domain-containing protein n=1 Tax=Blastococcus sp. TF02-8 TaxID=2250574 RepID=UPI000DEBFAA0|nr:DivIVA domain-containing protein [Blastococcus sp. TF02-8]RBY95963.1 DivIVA domain-containing protein [Blastococcus sp. TF02-8]
MLAFAVFVLAVLLVGGVLFLVASLLLGRGETRPPADAGRSPVELPADRPVTGGDVRAQRITVTARGYRMVEVDWLLDQLARALDERDTEIGALRSELEARAYPERPTDPGVQPADEEVARDA